MAQQHDRFLRAGSRLAAISVDTVGQNAAMADKLGLSFPVLSDPGGEGAIKPYGVWNPDASNAHPAVVVVTPDGEVARRWLSADFADRPAEDEVLAGVIQLALGPTDQPAPQPGTPQPGDRAVDLAWLPAYYRGAKFGVTAVKGRVPEAANVADVLTEEYDRYLAAVGRRRKDA